MYWTEGPMVVKLNVGGRLYMTTETTLNSRGGQHMLAALTRHSSAKVDDAIFIDRDPDIFRWVLNYLRGSEALPRRQTNEFTMLREEAAFFSLEGLVVRLNHIMSPNYEKDEHVLVEGTKFTVCGVSKDGFIVTRQNKKFTLSSAQNIEPTRVEVGDVVMAWRKESGGRRPGICMAIQGKQCTIQFNGNDEQETCAMTGVRF